MWFGNVGGSPDLVDPVVYMANSRFARVLYVSQMEKIQGVQAQCAGCCDDVLVQALEIYLCNTKMSSLRIMQGVEDEALLYRHKYDGGKLSESWSYVIEMAKSLLASVQNCIDNCRGFKQMWAPIYLASISKTETAFLWSVKASRTVDRDESQVYLNASKLMQVSGKCLLNALETHRERDLPIALLWVSAAEALSEAANVQVIRKANYVKGTASDSVSLLNCMTAVAEAKANALDCRELGRPEDLVHWQRLVRLWSVACALQCCAAAQDHNNQYTAAAQKAKRFSNCLLASIKLGRSIEGLRANQRHWAADILGNFASKLAGILNTGNPSAKTDALLSELALVESNLGTVVSIEKGLQARLAKCVENEANSGNHENHSQQVTTAWFTAARQTRTDIAALQAAVACADLTLQMQDFQVGIPAQKSEHFVGLAHCMDDLHRAMVTAERQMTNTCAISPPKCAVTEQERACYVNFASLLRRQLDICASLVNNADDCEARIEHVLPILNDAKSLALQYIASVAAARQARFCAAETPQDAQALVTVATWFVQSTETASQLLRDHLAPLLSPLECDEKSKNVESRYTAHDYYISQLSVALNNSKCIQLMYPDIVLGLVNAQLTVLLCILPNYTKSSVAATPPPGAFEPLQDTSNDCSPEIENTYESAERDADVLQQAIVVLQAAAASLKNMQFAPVSRNDWSYPYFAARRRAISVCEDIAACVKCVVDAALSGDVSLVSDCERALETFPHDCMLQPEPEDDEDPEVQPSELQWGKQHCRGRVESTDDASLRRCWRAAEFHFRHAGVLDVAGNQALAGSVGDRATELMEETEWLSLVPGFREMGYGAAVNLSEHAVRCMRAGEEIFPDLVHDMILVAENLPELDAHRKHCLEKARSCKNHLVKKVWAHLADLAVFSIDGIDVKFAANPTDLPFDVDKLMDLTDFIRFCIDAADLLAADASLLDYCSGELRAVILLPGAAGATSIRSCWQLAVRELLSLVDQAAGALLSVVGAANSNAIDMKKARTLVHTRVRSYLSIAYNYGQPAYYAHRRSTYLATSGVNCSASEQSRLRRLWMDAAQCFDRLVRVRAASPEKLEFGPYFNMSPDKHHVDAQRLLALAEHYTAALQATDPHVRCAYCTAHQQGSNGDKKNHNESVKLHVELAYWLERGAPEERLKALRAACAYSCFDAPVGERCAVAVAFQAHNLWSDQAEDIDRLLCAAQWYHKSESVGSSDTTERERKILYSAARLLANGTSTGLFYHAAAVELLRLAGLHRHIAFTVATSALPPVVLPYLARFAAAKLEEHNAQEKNGDAGGALNGPWRNAADSFRALHCQLSSAVDRLLISELAPSAGDTELINAFQTAAEWYTKAALARDCGNAELYQCWQLAAQCSDPFCSRASVAYSNYPETPRKYADAAEALQSGQALLYKALLSAAMLRQRLAREPQSTAPTQAQQLELRAADAAVDGARAECAGRHKVASLFSAAANKLTISAQKFTLAGGKSKRAVRRLRAAAGALLRKADCLIAETEEYFAVDTADTRNCSLVG